MTYKPTDNGETRYPREPEDPVMLRLTHELSQSNAKTTEAELRGFLARRDDGVSSGDHPCENCRAIGFHFAWCELTK